MKLFKIWGPFLVVILSVSQCILLREHCNVIGGTSQLSTSTAERSTSTADVHQGLTSSQCSFILNYIYSEKNSSGGAQSGIERVIDTTLESSLRLKDSAESSLMSAWLPTINDLWQHSIHPRLLPYILEWARSNLGKKRLSVVNLTRMDSDYGKAHNEFILPNLRKSAIHPMESYQMHNLLRIIERRLADPTANPPLEIMAFGPSIVEGVKSNYNNWWLPGYVGNKKGTYRDFAWPSGLQDLLNNVIFRGQNVVRVTNLGSGGTSSTSGALAMEYRLFAKTAPTPDIVIHSYGVTDTRYNDRDEDALRIIQDFVLAAKKVRCDPDGLPYVILYDDFLGLTDNVNGFHLDFAMKNLRAVSQAADWYNVMAVSYATAFRHTVYSGEGFGGTMLDQKDTVPNPSLHLPMLGWPLDVHPGMLYHSTAPWVLAFNLLENMVNACQDYSTLLHFKQAYPKLSTDHIPPATRDTLLRNLPKQWEKNIAAYDAMCKEAPTDGGSLCAPVSWLINGSSGKKKQESQDVESFLDAMSMSSLRGWFAEGGQQHRVGWVATAANATFTITIKDSDHDGIKTMSIIAMKSYGEKWNGSRLRVTVWDEGYMGQGPRSIVGQYVMDGVHNFSTSVFFDHKFYLGDKGIVKGNWLKAKFDLIGGTSFKIQGILFCSW